MTIACVVLYFTAVVGWAIAIDQRYARHKAEIDRDYHRECHRIWESCAKENLRTIHSIARDYVIVPKLAAKTVRPN